MASATRYRHRIEPALVDPWHHPSEAVNSGSVASNTGDKLDAAQHHGEQGFHVVSLGVLLDKGFLALIPKRTNQVADGSSATSIPG